MPKCVKICPNVAKICRSIDFPGVSEFTRASGGPQKGGKMTGMEILEFRDIKQPPHLGKIIGNEENAPGGEDSSPPWP